MSAALRPLGDLLRKIAPSVRAGAELVQQRRSGDIRQSLDEDQTRLAAQLQALQAQAQRERGNDGPFPSGFFEPALPAPARDELP